MRHSTYCPHLLPHCHPVNPAFEITIRSKYSSVLRHFCNRQLNFSFFCVLMDGTCATARVPALPELAAVQRFRLMTARQYCRAPRQDGKRSAEGDESRHAALPQGDCLPPVIGRKWCESDALRNLDRLPFVCDNQRDCRAGFGRDGMSHRDGM